MTKDLYVVQMGGGGYRPHWGPTKGQKLGEMFVKL